MDADLLALARQVAAAVRMRLQTGSVGVPPRRVGVALGLALQTAPHFSATLTAPVRAGSMDPKEPARRADFPALMPSNEILEGVLGISDWEIDELREDVDRRAGTALKQVRVVNWLWSHFDLSKPGALEKLGQALFPGLEASNIDLIRRGGHLYLLIDQREPAPEASLWLPWLARDRALAPTSFRSRGADPGLRSRLARGIGADDDEVTELLDGMVALLPRQEAARFLHLDQWRSSGRALMTDLGATYSAGEWLIQPIAPGGADWRSWLRIGGDGRLAVRGTPAQVFDALALPRVAAMVRLLYAALIASVDRDGLGAEGLRPTDLDLYDVPRHMREVLAPLMLWIASGTTHKAIASSMGRSTEEVAALLEEVAQDWRRQAESSWFGLPNTRAPSIQTLVLKHIIALHSSLKELMRLEPDPRWEHTDLMLLFVAHYLREARLERLWIRQLSDVAGGSTSRLPPTEDIAGHWFWRMFLHLLDQLL